MKKIFTLLTAILCMAVQQNTQAQVSGTVFRDYNGNGVKNNTATFNEPFVAGVTVKAFNAANVQVGATKTTDAAGAYSFTAVEIPSGTAVRIEFSGLATGDYTSANGTGNGTNVQFVTAGAGVTANFALDAPDDYWDNTGSPNPKLLSIVYAHGDINHTNSSNAAFGIKQIDNNTSGHTPTIVNVASQAQVGSVWGMGYQKAQNRFFFGSFLKRHVGFGPQGVGGVYMANLSGANYALSGSFTLQGVTPANSGTALDMGAVTRVSTPNTSDNYLATGTDAAGKDLDAFGKVGKVGFGDVEVDDKNQQLILVNLNQRRLVTVDISGTTATLNNASAATLGPLTRAYDILTLPGVPSCVSGQLRPFALKIYKGRGYLGAVCDASLTPRDSTKLAGYVLSFDPANITAGFTTELTLTFNYRTSTSNGNTNRWHSWADIWSDVRSSGSYRYPEPLISDLEFDENGGLNISITDRFGHQMGQGQQIAVAGSSTIIGESRISGDILHACRVSGAWVMEGSAGSCTVTNTRDNTDGYGDGVTVGAFEYYDDESGDNTAGEYTEGAMAKLMGTNRLVQTIVDPTSAAGTTGEPYWYSAGMHWYDVNTGNWSNWASMYDGSDAGAPAGTFMKGNGLGDIEFVNSFAPIEVGNRIWNDANGNGIQDAGEAGINGVVLTLQSPGPDGIFGTADDVTLATTTTATINGQAGSYFFSTLTTQDARKPTSWTGVTNIIPGLNYQIRIANAAGASQQAALAGLQLTKADAASNGFDNIDNDATLSGVNALLPFNTNNPNHNFDFGFKPLAGLGDRVWRDDNADGIQNGTEPGVAGITVSLYNGSGTLIGTTTTDAYGYYLFDNLVAGTYTVGFTLPANYTFTQQNTTAGDGSGAATDSDPITTAGATFGRTRTITLTAGQLQLNVDAGIKFNTPPVTQSVGDRVWLDNGGGVPANAANGIQDAGEPGVAGVTVTLYDNSGAAVGTTITDANGNYLFTNVPVGVNYTVGFSLPVGMVFSPLTGVLSGTTNSDVNTTTGRTVAFNVNSGDNITYIDAGIYTQSTANASLGDKVWEDINHDGIQNVNEPGIGAVTVNLYNGGTLIATTKTDAYGYYMFTNLAPGNYVVEFIKPSGYTGSPQTVSGGTSANNSDPSPTTGRTASVNLKAGDRNTSIDAGMYKTSPAGTLKLGDKVWNDYNRNGIQDANEPGVAGLTAKLFQNGPDGLPGTPDDILIATTFTDANGNYLFVNLAASAGATTNYNVQFFNVPTGFSFTLQNSTGSTAANDDDANRVGQTGSINLTADNLTIDTGLVLGTSSGKGSLGNKVWYDLNSNGIQDAGELGVAGVTVTLQKDINGDGVFSGVSETSFASTTTNSLGEYLFGDLDAASYKVVFSNMPVGYIITTKDAGAATDETDSDGDNAGVTIAGATTSTTGVYVLAQGEDNLSVDLGLQQPANRNTLGDFVWFDQNNDGLQAGEPGVQGVMVTLYNNAGTAIAYTTTDPNGQYLFTGLADGTYSVGFSNLPPGFDFTTQSGSNDLTGSDANTISGKTTTVTLTFASGGTNRDNRSLDAGIISTRAALGDKVWLDTNGDGVQGAGEAGIAGVTVTLYASDGTTILASTITDQNGKYLFSNLTAGTYVVGFATIPGGLEFTQQNTPGDNGNNTNSDANTVTGKTAVITLTASETDLTIDAGIRPKPTATVGDYVWSDLNSDGIQDVGEPGIGGIVVTLYNSLNQPIGSAVTDGTGKYLITNVPPGTGYYVIFSNSPNNPSGLQPSFTVQGAAGGTNTSHADAAGKSNTFTVNAGDNITNIDAGIKDYSGRAVLALQRLDVSATLISTTVSVNWVTENESNTDKFIVERSVDNVNFVAVGEKAAAGTYAGVRNYSHNDDISALTQYTVIYYRIRLINADGGSSYSKVAAVRINPATIISVWPNPFIDKVTISLRSPANTFVQVRIVDITGRTLSANSYHVVKGNNQLDITGIEKLPAATYLLQVSDEDGQIRYTQKLTKK